jgi:SSS family solute:Na+ symporter
LFWLLFGFQTSAGAVGISQLITGKAVIITTMPWPLVDPIIIALPIAVIATIVVTLLTKPPEKEFVDRVFKGVGGN